MSRSGFNFGGTDRALIRRIKDLEGVAKKASYSALKRVAEGVVEGARMRAPEKDGSLAASVMLSPVAAPSIFSRSSYDIVVSAGPTYNNGREYSVLMHEGVPNVMNPPYLLGPVSEEKNQGKSPHQGEGVGYKFLERAFQDASLSASNVMRDTTAEKISEWVRSIVRTVR